MDKKLTDSEIVKALECCTKREHQCCNDGECPLFYKTVTYSECRWKLLKETTDLINRQQEEKQSLKYDYDNLKRQFDEIYQQFHYLSNVEIPYLYSFTEDKDKKLETIANILLRTKAEAYKDCIEKVKEKAQKYEWVSSGVHLRTEYTIGENSLDNLLKEMVGEDNG